MMNMICMITITQTRAMTVKRKMIQMMNSITEDIVVVDPLSAENCLIQIDIRKN